jgi:DNA-binding MarR family transcriptional regulator
MMNEMHQLDKAFESHARLLIMTLLAASGVLDFAVLRRQTGLTDGNLASHLSALEKQNYIDVKKSFVGRKPNTRYFITDAGKEAFKAHLSALETLIKSTN